MKAKARGVSLFVGAVVCVFWLFAGGVTAFASPDGKAGSEMYWKIETQTEAEKIVPKVSCKALTRSNLRKLTDGDAYTYLNVKKAAVLQCKTSVPVKGLYLMWEKSCRWTLALPDGSERKGGKDGFLHEYVALDKPVKAFSLRVPANAKMTEIYAFTEGKLPEWVQVWEPPCEKADLMILSTHADDEHLWFGGAMPYYAGELGYRVQVVYLTHHPRQTYRGHELLNGLWTVGVRNYPVITEKFRDSIVTKASLEKAAAYFGRKKVLAFQVEMLRRFSPKVVLGQDINGEYGHGAHKLNAATLLDALKIYDDPQKFPESAAKYGTGKVGKCYLHLWDKNTVVVSWSGKTLEKFGGKTAFEMACEGYQCHKSQLRWNNHVKESGKYDCRKFGLVYTTVGYDTPGVNDLFEHIDMPDRKQPAAEEKPADSVSESDAPQDSTAADAQLDWFGNHVLKKDVKMGGTVILTVISLIIFGICLKRRGLIHKSPVSTE